jgi:hypothetical protein
MKQVAELKDFSDSTQSETFEKISKMNENIGAKNREIAELSRAQRADKKTISQARAHLYCDDVWHNSNLYYCMNCSVRLRNPT